CTDFYTNIQSYLPTIPTDPNGTTYYTYTYSGTGPSFILSSTLSNSYVYQFDSTTSAFSILGYSSTCVSGGGLICTETTDGSYVINTYTYSSAPGSTTWQTPAGVTTVEYLVVGGGGSGSGGTSGWTQGGGGGAGAVLSGSGYGVSGSISVVVGAGGSAVSGFAIGNNGSASIFNGVLTAAGGGGGGTVNHNVYTNQLYGSGGDCGDGVHIGGATGPKEVNGGSGGGAGAGQDGYPNPNASGGNGVTSLIIGTSTYYGGGGGGAVDTGSSGGLGGGGAGRAAGVNGLGGGGGGGYGSAPAGGSGVVIIRYLHP
ncbi:MAG: glycine-rich domain-containing protein, partial [Candidatus Paceibacterota bacterium]